MEILSRKLNLAGKPGGGIMPYWTSIRALEINHIFYADDILIFSNGGKASFIKLMQVLEDFCCNSGQVLQPAKCKLFFSKHVNHARRNELFRLSGYGIGSFPVRYLGAPLFPGAPRLRYFQSLVDSVKERIQGWSKNFLSMAGRLTMIKSVLGSIPIHTLSVLNVPKGTLDAIERLIRSYLWNGSDHARRHWVNWDTICSDVSAGGLGIRPLKHMMMALRGKLAWKYLCNDSLWSKHARSRFTIGGKGSHLWRNISPVITSIALECRWNLGDGSTRTGTFCHNLGLVCPRRFRELPIREILSTPNLRREFMHNINPRIYLSLNGSFREGVSDLLIWDKEPSGFVTTQSFLRILSPIATPVRRFVIIWQHWLPPKVSCFLWRILHHALPTNDNVMRVGIPLASKCYCCTSPASESMDHLFISGQLADILWCFLCPLFRKQRPRSLREFFHDWGSCVRFKRFTSFLGFGLGCLGLWEIWKYRNAKVHDEAAPRFSKHLILCCADALAKLTPGKSFYDLHARLVCHSLGIPAPPISQFKVFWSPWLPTLNGNSCNVAIGVSGDVSKIAAIIRSSQGSFLYALKASSPKKHFVKCLFHITNELLWRGFRFVRLQVSHEDISYLGKDSLVDWNLFSVKRRLVAALRNVLIFRISFSLNLPAEALCFSDCDDMATSSMDSLPDAVRKAIQLDGSIHPCSFYDQRVFI